MDINNYPSSASFRTHKDSSTGKYVVEVTRYNFGTVVGNDTYEFDIGEEPSALTGIYASLHPTTYLTDTVVRDRPLYCTYGGGSGIRYAFLGCKSLTNLTYARDLIGGPSEGDFYTHASYSDDNVSAFEGCTALTTVDLGEYTNITASTWPESSHSPITPPIYVNMFKDCINLTTITGIIDISISESEDLLNMFKNCTNLSSVQFKQNSDVTSGKNLFSENITVGGTTYNYLYEVMGLTAEQVTTLGLTTDEITPSA